MIDRPSRPTHAIQFLHNETGDMLSEYYLSVKVDGIHYNYDNGDPLYPEYEGEKIIREWELSYGE